MTESSENMLSKWAGSRSAHAWQYFVGRSWNCWGGGPAFSVSAVEMKAGVVETFMLVVMVVDLVGLAGGRRGR